MTAPKPSGRRRQPLNGAQEHGPGADSGACAPLEADPELLLSRPRPLLIDEWKNVAEVWDVVRHAVDRDPSGSQFLLAGSATPRAGATAHSGAGRIGRFRMRPMTLEEREGWGAGREPDAPFRGRSRAV